MAAAPLADVIALLVLNEKPESVFIPQINLMIGQVSQKD